MRMFALFDTFEEEEKRLKFFFFFFCGSKNCTVRKFCSVEIMSGTPKSPDTNQNPLKRFVSEDESEDDSNLANSSLFFKAGNSNRRSQRVKHKKNNSNKNGNLKDNSNDGGGNIDDDSDSGSYHSSSSSSDDFDVTLHVVSKDKKISTPRASIDEIKTVLANLKNFQENEHGNMDEFEKNNYEKNMNDNFFDEIAQYEQEHMGNTSNAQDENKEKEKENENIKNDENKESENKMDKNDKNDKDDKDKENDNKDEKEEESKNEKEKENNKIEGGVKLTKMMKPQKHGKHRYMNEYLIYKELGKGAYSRVILARKMCKNGTKNGSKVAIKVINKGVLRRIIIWISAHKKSNELSSIAREIAIMKLMGRGCQHPNICQLYEVIDDPVRDKLYLVLEYMSYGTLLKDTSQKAVVEPIKDINLIRYYMRDMILGIEYLHDNNIVHSDIKPDNLLLTHEQSNDDDSDNDKENNSRMKLKIADFGTSYVVNSITSPNGDGYVTRNKGTPAFTAPETEDSPFLAWPLDIWACGVTLYQMITGICPFAGESIMDTYEKIRKYAPKMDYDDWDDNFKDFIQRILEKNPQKRLTINEMKCHKWITNNGKLDVLKQPSFVKLNKVNSNDYGNNSNNNAKDNKENKENQENTDNSSNITGNDDKKEDVAMQSADSVKDNNANANESDSKEKKERKRRIKGRYFKGVQK